jgi:hypothetical protein
MLLHFIVRFPYFAEGDFIRSKEIDRKALDVGEVKLVKLVSHPVIHSPSLKNLRRRPSHIHLVFILGWGAHLKNGLWSRPL